MTLFRAFPSVSLMLASLIASPATAQNTSSGAGADRGGWRLAPSISTTEEFDNNVFLLPERRKDNLGSAGAKDATGRYVDMASASDVITTLRGALELERRGLGGRRLTVTPEVGYELYTRNRARSSSQFGISMEQKLGGGGMARIRASMSPRAFVKNYLYDAVDSDGDGSITPDERLYARAQQGDQRFRADFTHVIDKSSRNSPFGTALRVGAGWYSRSNNTAFVSRDLSGPTLDLALLIDLTADTRLRVGYDLEALAAPRVDNVVLLDEARFDEDFNGNSTRDDLQVRSVRMIDRSRTEHELGVALESELSRRVDARLTVGQRRRIFSSAERYDVANNGRRDLRSEIDGELRFRVASRLRLHVSAGYASQSINRAGAIASTGDVADYTRLRGSAGLTLRY